MAQFSLNATIQRISLDGRNRKVLISEKLIAPNAVAVDFPVKKIYWADNLLEMIERANYDGSERKIVRRGFSIKLYSMSVFENHIYFYSWKHNNLFQVDKFNTHKMESVVAHDVSVAEAVSHLSFVKVFHRQVQPIDLYEWPHRCQILNGDCDHFCVPDTRNNPQRNTRCICKFGYVYKHFTKRAYFR